MVTEEEKNKERQDEFVEEVFSHRVLNLTGRQNELLSPIISFIGAILIIFSFSIFGMSVARMCFGLGFVFFLFGLLFPIKRNTDYIARITFRNERIKRESKVGEHDYASRKKRNKR